MWQLIYTKQGNLTSSKGSGETVCMRMGGSRGGQGVRTHPPLKNHNHIGFPSNTGPDPLKNHKVTKLTFDVGPSTVRQ